METATSSLAPSDKRAQVRLPCHIAVVPHLAAGQALSDHWNSIVQDLAPGGVGLLLPEKLEPGTRLAIEVPAHGGSRPWEVRVVHATQQPDGRWLHGCASAQDLSPEDLLETLLAGLPEETQSAQEAPVALSDVPEDCFVVLVRPDRESTEPEQPVANCKTQEEARAVQQQLRATGAECVIRYVAPAGGGD
jgi:hypothetical protein